MYMHIHAINASLGPLSKNLFLTFKLAGGSLTLHSIFLRFLQGILKFFKISCFSVAVILYL